MALRRATFRDRKGTRDGELPGALCRAHLCGHRSRGWPHLVGA